MYELMRLAQLIGELQQHIVALHERNNNLVNAYNLSSSEIAKCFNNVNNDLRNIATAFQGMSRRIDTLEILASKKFAEEIEEPIASCEKRIVRNVN